MLIVAATNRPKSIDRAVLDRFHRRVNCPLPTDEELSRIIDVHLGILTTEQKRILYNNMISSCYRWNGRDIKHLADELATIKEVGQITNPDYVLTAEDIVQEFDYLVNSKKHLKDDYLEMQDSIVVESIA